MAAIVITDISQDLVESIRRHARYTVAKELTDLTVRDMFLAAALTVRERLIDGLLETERRYASSDAKRLYYLSMEFLMGRSLGNNLYNMGLFDAFKDALSDMGYDVEEVRETESDAALGNGGLGRLAACFLDSMATLGMPGFGYGINYDYGLFKQEIENGYQKEKPDHWRAYGTPWLIERPDEACIIPIGGRIEHAADRQSNYNPMWLDWKVMIGVPYDMPIVGYGGRTVNYLRLYSAVSSAEFDMQIFNRGDYIKAVEQKISSETVSKVLYPAASDDAGKELRVIQEYFLVACSIRDIVRRYQKTHINFDQFADKVAIQLNDTHPALTVAELMRIMVDENDLEWEDAWEITRAAIGYTNHTLLPEALERWPVALFHKILPRHLQIIEEINRRLMTAVEAKWPGDNEKKKKVSIIEDGYESNVRMGHLAILGSHSVNGVAALHSELVKTTLVPEFYQMFPERFNNKTNGVTQRRWLLKANPKLASLISGVVGDAWITDLARLRELEAYSQEQEFQQGFAGIKHANKQRLARVIKETTGVTVNPDSMFDVQVKRIHEYKRQLLNVMHVIHLYFSIIEDEKRMIVPRTCIFAGKAAPGYWVAKQIIKLINNVARVINADKRVQDYLKVVFIPDYRVSLAEKIIPAADLSEQISTAGKEASGTGNMKFAMNGALTMGTLDGANIEIREEVGAENIFIFGLTAAEIEEMRRNGSYRPRDYYDQNADIKRVMDSFRSNIFSQSEPGLFESFFNSVLGDDQYFHLADLKSYIEAQQEAAQEFLDPVQWFRKSILNVSRIGKFSSDRTVREYAADIWKIQSY